jgi:DNA-binding transcriptional regulator YhcF (GntR family)
MHLTLNRTSPTPLYHQIFQAIRWRIGIGALRAGDALPVMREAAVLWAVNYHTVRRAYHELAAAGWIETVQGSGTVVAAAPPPHVGTTAEGDVEQWLDQVVETGKLQYGLTPEVLATRIRTRGRVLRVVMVECNAHQSSFLARQLEQAWPVEAVAWSLDEPGEPPRLPLIGTYFHHAEMRARWPHRIDDMWFVALWLDRTLEERVIAAGARRGGRRLRLVEQDPGTAEEMAAGVSALLSPRFEVTATVGDPAELLQTLAEDELLLVAPRMWDRLPAAVQQDERVLDVRHVVIPDELQRVWASLSGAGSRWERTSTTGNL